jgi:ABC-2 type transport system permease protein
VQKIKKLFQTAGTKNGAFSVGITIMVIAVIVVINLIFGQLPEKYRNIDVSSTKIYEISDTSRKLLKKLDSKVTLTVLAEKENTDDRIKTFLSKYDALSKNVSVKWIDPVLHPSVLKEYDVDKNTIVVLSEASGKSTNVSFDSIIVKDESSYYYTGTASESQFDADGQLTSAVNYVTSDVNKTIYRTTGHGEATLSGSVSDMMSKNNYSTKELNLVMDASIPDDCDLLLMYAPATDLSADELKTIKDYLSGGGKIMVLLGETGTSDLPNLSSILKEYGMQEAEGYIADPQRCYQNNYYYIFPNLSLSGDMAKGISSQMVLLMNAKGLNMVDAARDTITTDSFMTTSEQAYAVTEDKQTQGTYTLGAVATEKTDKAESRLTVISAASLIDSQITDTFSQLENVTVFMNAVGNNFDDVQSITIEPKSLAPEYNTVQHAGLFSLLVVFGIPILVLGSGFTVWFRRRKA